MCIHPAKDRLRLKCRKFESFVLDKLICLQSFKLKLSSKQFTCPRQDQHLINVLEKFWNYFSQLARSADGVAGDIYCVKFVSRDHLVIRTLASWNNKSHRQSQLEIKILGNLIINQDIIQRGSLKDLLYPKTKWYSVESNKNSLEKFQYD